MYSFAYMGWFLFLFDGIIETKDERCTMELVVINRSSQKVWQRYKTDFLTIADRAAAVLHIEEELCASVIFVSPEEMQEINRYYRTIDRPTDVISFALQDKKEDYEMMEEDAQLGDIFINVEAVRQQAEEYGHSKRREVCFLFVHGLLHLLGYDHMTKEEEAKMFLLQDVILDEIVPKKKNA